MQFAGTIMCEDYALFKLRSFFFYGDARVTSSNEKWPAHSVHQNQERKIIDFTAGNTLFLRRLEGIKGTT